MLANKMKIKDLEMQKKIEAERLHIKNNTRPASKDSDRSGRSKNNDLLNIISGKTYLHNGTILGPGRFGAKHN